MGKDSFYFTHDCNARHDPKIAGLIGEYGIAGYGAFWIIIEMLRESDDYKLPKRHYVYKSIEREFNGCSTDVQQMFNDCSLFVKKLEEDFDLLKSDNDFFWSESLLRRMSKLDDKRAKASIAGKKSAESKAKQIKYQRNSTDVQQTFNHESKLHESKLHESKLHLKQKRTYKEEMFDFSNLTDDFKKAMTDFIEHRKEKKKPLTTRSFNLILKELDSLGQNELERIQILNRSIMNGWQGIFSLNEQKTVGKGKRWDDGKIVYNELTTEELFGD